MQTVSALVYLAHESWDDPVEAGALVTKTLLPSAQSTEVLCKIKKN